MRLKDIDLIHFRNYDHLYLELNPHINIFIGKNGMGKTNLLESIYVLAITKSHRMLGDNHLIQQDSNGFRIVGNLETLDGEKQLEVKITKTSKNIKVNDQLYHRISSYISNLNILIFCPDDLDIIKGSPGIRRKFLNVEISQLFPQYLRDLNEYRKILNQRNEYLKTIQRSQKKDVVYFQILNRRFMDIALRLYQYRKRFIEELNQQIAPLYEGITGLENLHLVYRTSVDLSQAEEEVQKEFEIKLSEREEKEIVLGTTLLGPHRDDFSFFLGKNDLKSYGSQGQQRLAIITLKLAEIELFQTYTHELPILLLDDIFSELDSSKVGNLIQFIKNDIQVIITTTELNHLEKQLIEDASVFKIQEGTVEKQ